jgi:hypothetical protein
MYLSLNAKKYVTEIVPIMFATGACTSRKGM